MRHLLVATLIACAVGLLDGCAAERYLTSEEDAEMRRQCAAGGCTCLPTEKWNQIEQLLRRLGIWRDA